MSGMSRRFLREATLLKPERGCAKCGRVFSENVVECRHHDRGICSRCCMDEDLARRAAEELDRARERIAARETERAAESLLRMGFVLPSGIVLRRTT